MSTNSAPIRIAINGFGRMGRLACRIANDYPDLKVVHVNEPSGDAESAAHLLTYDSVHGTWDTPVTAATNELRVGEDIISYSQNLNLEDTDWQALDVDVVIDCSGKFKSQEKLEPYFAAGVKKVVVSAPIKDGTLNIVMGVNDSLYDPDKHKVVTAASCTTNCIAPAIKVLRESFGIRHGSITTVHDITNTQRILDSFHKDLRRARSCGQSLIPTSTGSATAITEIFPDMAGKIDGLAIRVPLANSSITDCVFEVERAVTVEEVNETLRTAAEGELKGILGYETKPLVSVDYTNDIRSSIVDALSTRVVNGTQVKLFLWYDNEMGYAHRLVELTQKVAYSI